MKQPIVTQQGLYPNWEKGGWGPETAADMQVLAGWRSKLRDSLTEWDSR